jgi:hypothetical protein
VAIAAVANLQAAADHREGQVKSAVAALGVFVAPHLDVLVDMLGLGWQPGTHTQVERRHSDQASLRLISNMSVLNGASAQG